MAGQPGEVTNVAYDGGGCPVLERITQARTALLSDGWGEDSLIVRVLASLIEDSETDRHHSTPTSDGFVTVPLWALRDYEDNSIVLAARDRATSTRVFEQRHRRAFRAIHAAIGQSATNQDAFL